MQDLYDTIGHGYRHFRQPDPRIASAILEALGDAASVVNVGAGTGSYEPRDRSVVAVEPSMTMIRQRPRGSAPVVQGFGTALPFRDETFDASLAILTIHHWPEPTKGLHELRRTARRRVVILTWDPAFPGFWLTDYFPQILEIDRLIFPSLDTLSCVLGSLEILDIPIPHDCVDGFLGAYWQRPVRYLDPGTRAAISTFSKISDLESGLWRLRNDLTSGEWHQRYGELLNNSAADLGYRIVVAHATSGH